MLSLISSKCLPIACERPTNFTLTFILVSPTRTQDVCSAKPSPGCCGIGSAITVERTGHHTGAGLRRCLDFIVRRAGRNHDRVHFAEQREDSDVFPAFLASSTLARAVRAWRIVRLGKTKPV